MKVTINGFNTVTFDDAPDETVVLEGTREQVETQMTEFAEKYKSISITSIDEDDADEKPARHLHSV